MFCTFTELYAFSCSLLCFIVYGLFIFIVLSVFLIVLSVFGYLNSLSFILAMVLVLYCVNCSMGVSLFSHSSPAFL